MLCVHSEAKYFPELQMQASTLVHLHCFQSWVFRAVLDGKKIITLGLVVEKAGEQL